jgi:hypothetical protein
MIIKGEIGQEVLIKAKIRGGGLFGDKTYYTVEIEDDDEDGNKVSLYLESDQVIIKEPKKVEIKNELVVEKPERTPAGNKKAPSKTDRSVTAKRIDALFSLKNMTVKDFIENFNTYSSKKLGMSTFFGHKNGTNNVSDEMLKAYAEYFNVDVAYLKGEQDERRKFNQKRATVESTMAKLEKMKAKEAFLNE